MPNFTGSPLRRGRHRVYSGSSRPLLCRYLSAVEKAMSLNDARAKRGVEPDAEQWAGTFESAPLAMSFAMPDGRLGRVNDAYCDMLGYRRDELLRRSFQELTHPDDIDADVALLGELLDGRRSQHNLEKRFLHADGHVVWARLAVTLVRSHGCR